MLVCQRYLGRVADSFRGNQITEPSRPRQSGSRGASSPRPPRALLTMIASISLVLTRRRRGLHGVRAAQALLLFRFRHLPSGLLHPTARLPPRLAAAPVLAEGLVRRQLREALRVALRVAPRRVRGDLAPLERVEVEGARGAPAAGDEGGGARQSPEEGPAAAGRGDCRERVSGGAGRRRGGGAREGAGGVVPGMEGRRREEEDAGGGSHRGAC